MPHPMPAIRTVPLRSESAGTNLKDASMVGPEILKIRSIMGPSMPVIVDIYATPHASYPDGSSQIGIGRDESQRCLDGWSGDTEDSLHYGSLNAGHCRYLCHTPCQLSGRFLSDRNRPGRISKMPRWLVRRY